MIEPAAAADQAHMLSKGPPAKNLRRMRDKDKPEIGSSGQFDKFLDFRASFVTPRRTVRLVADLNSRPYSTLLLPPPPGSSTMRKVEILTIAKCVPLVAISSCGPGHGT
jgi:hypothetical protein